MAHILVLEDDTDMRELVAECLEDHGHEVYEAESSKQAIALASIHKLDLAVTDVRMKTRDGIETLRLLKQTQPDLRAIVITGYASEDAPGRAIEVEVEDYIYKPFKLKDLMLSIQRVLGREEEQSGYRSLMKALTTGYQRLREKATTALLDREMAGVDRARQRALQAFYVAVRSELLVHAQAYHFWTQLIPIEAQRELLKREELPIGELKELGTRYQYLADVLATLGRINSVQLKTAQQEVHLSRELFGVFFGRVKSGALSAEQLKLAEFLRNLDPSVRQQSAELSRLYSEMWAKSGTDVE